MYIVCATKGSLCIPVGIVDTEEQANDLKRRVEKASDSVSIDYVGDDQATLGFD